MEIYSKVSDTLSKLDDTKLYFLNYLCTMSSVYRLLKEEVKDDGEQFNNTYTMKHYNLTLKEVEWFISMYYKYEYSNLQDVTIEDLNTCIKLAFKTEKIYI